MPMNAEQKGFVGRLGLLAGLLLVEQMLVLLVSTGMVTPPPMGESSAFQVVGGTLFVAASVLAIVTLRYGRKHEAVIRERSGLSGLLTVYRILFWSWIAFIVLGVIFFGGLAVLFTHPVG